MSESASIGRRPIIIGVAGGSGSGKTTVLERIVERLGSDRVTCIQHDSYYIDRGDLALEERAAINYDHPDAFDWDLLNDRLVDYVMPDVAWCGGISSSVRVSSSGSIGSMVTSAEPGTSR